jgi:hypothetical protein
MTAASDNLLGHEFDARNEIARGLRESLASRQAKAPEQLISLSLRAKPGVPAAIRLG